MRPWACGQHCKIVDRAQGGLERRRPHRYSCLAVQQVSLVPRPVAATEPHVEVHVLTGERIGPQRGDQPQLDVGVCGFEVVQPRGDECDGIGDGNASGEAAGRTDEAEQPGGGDRQFVECLAHRRRVGATVIGELDSAGVPGEQHHTELALQ